MKPYLSDVSFHGNADMTQGELQGFEAASVRELQSLCPCGLFVRWLYGNPMRDDPTRFAIAAEYSCGSQKKLKWNGDFPMPAR